MILFERERERVRGKIILYMREKSFTVYWKQSNIYGNNKVSFLLGKSSKGVRNHF